MKKNWVVYITQSVGHELHDSIVESEFFGPYTKEIAEDLAGKINDKVYLHCRDREAITACAMPLNTTAPVDLLRRLDTDLLNYAYDGGDDV